MRQLTKTSVLLALVITTVGLSLVLFDLNEADAQGGSSSDAWIADDAQLAVRTLIGTQSYSYLDRVFIPGMHRNDAPSEASLKVMGYKNKAPKIMHRNDAGFTYRAFRPEPTPYVPKNGYPSKLATPKTEATKLAGIDDGGGLTKGATKFKGEQGGAPKGTIIKSGQFKTKPDDRKASKFALSIKSREKIGKIPVTRTQLKAFKTRIKAAKRDGTATASAVFPGSRNDEPAVFVPIVRVRNGIVEDFRITAR